MNDGRHQKPNKNPTQPTRTAQLHTKTRITKYQISENRGSYQFPTLNKLGQHINYNCKMSAIKISESALSLHH